MTIQTKIAADRRKLVETIRRADFWVSLNNLANLLPDDHPARLAYWQDQQNPCDKERLAAAAESGDYDILNWWAAIHPADRLDLDGQPEPVYMPAWRQFLAEMDKDTEPWGTDQTEAREHLIAVHSTGTEAQDNYNPETQHLIQYGPNYYTFRLQKEDPNNAR